MDTQRSIHSTDNSIISTGSLRLDIALGTGGLPAGQITMISGPGESGKTTLCHHIVAEAQKTGRICAWIDSDHTFNQRYAVACGVIADQLYLAEPATAEAALDMVDLLAGSGELAVIVVDSIKGLVSQAEINAEIGKAGYQDIDRILAYQLRSLQQKLNHAPTIIIFTNPEPLRMSQVYYHLSEHTERLALPLAAAVHLKACPSTSDQQASQTDELRIKIDITKNKFAPCFKSIELVIIVNRGINKTIELIELGQSLDIISPAPYYYYSRHLALGMDNHEAVHTLISCPEIASEIEQVIRMKALPF
jgi:recombination protein RecA